MKNKKLILKNCHFLLIMLSIHTHLLLAQNDQNWPYFEKYDSTQKKLIKEHWTQYFKNDIHRQLDNNLNAFPIKFDSYGSLYPDSLVFNSFNSNNFELGMKDKNLYKYSIFTIFENNSEKIEKNISLIADKKEREEYKKYLTKGFINNEDIFYEQWDQYHYQKIASELNNKIKNYNKVVFFIHGYNVPYSLAVIQLIELANLLKKNKIETDSVLFVPVFWPSNNAKACILDSKEVFSTENFKGFNIRGIKNGLKFLHYTNRAYFAALGLRSIINLTNFEDKKIYIFSHSLGGVVATTMLIDTYSKLDLDMDLSIYKNATELYQAKKGTLDEVSEGILQTMTATKNKPPNQKMKVFLSAAAMPGVYTFKDMDKATIKNKEFYCTINLDDEMITKTAIPLPGVSASNMNATGLGCNYDNDALKTQMLFENPSQFNFRLVSNNQDHDILTYMKQEHYKQYVLEFFRE